ncbi:hypothetical protein PC113_g22197 [Phytophthora cactorum]|uniref:Uncharacterized protein n=2 Tax=Phytophthora cactorum TaxID=29920 RepID=A0A8T0Y862_9STRA|nr:hypothetical protein PC113_g22197 [Phytophthora cactorum]
MCAIFLLWSANCVPEEEVDVWQHLTGEERDVKASTTETRSLCENYRILVDREKAFGLQDVANEEADMENLEEEANDDDITKPGNANATAVMGDKDATTGEKGMDGGGTGAPRQQRDYGQRTYKLQKIKTRITYSKDRHILAPFSWKRVVESKAPALLFLGACSAVAGVRGLARIPDDPQHLLDALDTTSILRLVEEGALENRKQADFARQTTRNRESAIHVDHGRVVSYLLPCARDCFKIWVFFPPATEKITHFNYVNKKESFNRMLRTTGSGVLIQRPGDVVCLNNLVFHSVLLVYKPSIAEQDKWGGLFGDVVVCEADRVESFRYATKVASGPKRGSRKAWESLLSAYCVMEGRDYDNFEKEKKRFYEKLQLPEKSAIARTRANAKKDKKR